MLSYSKLITVITGTVVAVSALPALVASAAPEKPRIVLVGDSTVTEGEGWGRGFKRFVDPTRAECINEAKSGRSSKSYRAEGHWDKALAQHGEYYLIQFGHNDQPGKGPDRETEPATTFTENMARYVDDVRAQGGNPILVTSLTRRNFDPEHPDKLKDTLGPYVDAVRKLAAAKHVPLVDLYARSQELVEKLGPTTVAKLNPPDVKKGVPDTTHLDAAGSVVFARLVVNELRKGVPELASVLLANPAEESVRSRVP
jgi:pectinesterase